MEIAAILRAEAARAERKGKSRLLPKEKICSFYQQRAERAADREELQAIRLVDVHRHLRRAGLGLSFDRIAPALRRALFDLNQRIQREWRVQWFGIRTNGSLWVRLPPGADLDSPVPAGKAGSAPAKRAAEAAAAYGTSAEQHPDEVRLEGVGEGGRVRLPPWIVLREGAPVTVIASKDDVREEPWAPRAFPGELLDRMIGMVSYGGDALIDSEAEPD